MKMRQFKVTTNQRVLYLRTDTAMHAKEELNFGTRDGYGMGGGGRIRWQSGEMILGEPEEVPEHTYPAGAGREDI